MIFVCSATHKTKSMFFFLAQTEQGDIFKITLETDEDMVSSPWLEGKRLKYSILFATLLSCLIILGSLQWPSLASLTHTRMFFLLQVTEIRLKYFDTVPVAAAMCVLKTGFLFVASEFGNQ